jgi:phosphoglycerol transferase MdoB-like AlkP superfamily enzyme
MKKIFTFLIQKFKEAAIQFFQLHIVFAIVFFVLRFVEIGLEWNAHGKPKLLSAVIGYGLIKDASFILTAGLWLFIFYYLLFLLHQKLAKILYIIIAVLMITVQLALTNYFITTLVPLGSDLWTYSIADIKQTVGAAGIQVSVIIALIVVIAATIFTFIKLPKKIKSNVKIGLIFFVALFLSQRFAISSKSSKLKTSVEQSTNISINKSYFFYKQTITKIFPEEPDLDIYADSYINDFGDETAQKTKSFQYIDENNFPFLHKEETEDVLSPFLNKSETPPNIVVILTEGLGRAFTNSGAYLGNFTPFLDSLSQKSLYWENFLSEGGRTFAVLPSVLGSLPFAKNGFCEMGDNAPKHVSLVSLLKHNGYFTNFYYGGDSHFDYMDVFLKNASINQITDIKSFPSGYTKMPASASGFSWGYGDKELFRCFLTGKNALPNKPQLNVLLTVSTHSPFLINDQEQYYARFEQRLNELGFDATKKQEYNNYKQQYASVLYTDDAFKKLFEDYSKRPDFNNTVFIITGDHRLPEIPMSTKADRYHVPLIIYSPLLNRSAKFSSVSTHFDIAPTVLAWLKNQYNFSIPTLSSWMGNGIDTSRAFRNIHNYPFMQTKNEVNGYMLGNYFLNSDDLFELGSGMNLNPLQDEGTKSRVKASFENFKKKNNKIINGAKLIPDSIYQKYSK